MLSKKEEIKLAYSGDDDDRIALLSSKHSEVLCCIAERGNDEHRTALLKSGIPKVLSQVALYGTDSHRQYLIDNHYDVEKVMRNVAFACNETHRSILLSHPSEKVRSAVAQKCNDAQRDALINDPSSCVRHACTARANTRQLRILLDDEDASVRGFAYAHAPEKILEQMLDQIANDEAVIESMPFFPSEFCAKIVRKTTNEKIVEKALDNCCFYDMDLLREEGFYVEKIADALTSDFFAFPHRRTHEQLR